MKHDIFNNFLRLLAVIIFSTPILSCRDEVEKPYVEEYFIEVTINDAVVKFDDQASIGAIFNQYEGQYELGIYGNIGDFTGILIHIYDGEPLGTGSYSGLAQQEGFWEGVRFSFVDDLDNYLTDPEDPTGSVEILQMNDTIVRGNFSGVLKHLTSEETINISNGKFYVKHSN
ncbi:MAG: hypothetical protein RBS53_09270 [Bacteroidales bacterium]|jgi:hypothetical protein|nr:hypothetical protein [Bacteroidales bacterium]NLM92918.1 hypothetical protein [Bacteroidales bacterium]